MATSCTIHLIDGHSITYDFDTYIDGDRPSSGYTKEEYLYRIRASIFANEPICLDKGDSQVIVNARNIEYFEVKELNDGEEVEQ